MEVGGAYGGSIRALASYLAHSDPNRLEHDILFYYPTPEADRLRPFVSRITTLFPASSHQTVSSRVSLFRRAARTLSRLVPPRFGAWSADYVALIRSVPIAAHLYRMIQAGHYDLVHANNSFLWALPTILAAHRLGIPLVAHVRNPVRSSLVAKWLLGRADCIVTVADFYRATLASWLPSARIHTCRDGIERPVVDANATQALRRRLAPIEGALVGSVGRLDPQKGYEYFVEAARVVLSRRTDVRFVIAGEGPSRQRLEALIAALGLRDHFVLCGYRADVPDVLAALDVFVSSSIWEGLPLAVAEAMLVGTPVVATDVGGTPEVVLDGHTGYLVPARDPSVLATAILKSLAEPEASALMAQKATEHAATLLNAAAAARDLDFRLSSVLGRRDSNASLDFRAVKL